MAILLAAWVASLASAEAGPPRWRTLENCRLDAEAFYDGDSFHVLWKGKDYIFRLYFVDAPETSDKPDDARLKDQAEYFDISRKRAARAGREAKDATREFLAEPFTVYTRMEDAKGSSDQPRYFALVRRDGRDLGEVLVGKGLARVYGKGTDLPDRTKEEAEWRTLHRLEAQARREKAGAWRWR